MPKSELHRQMIAERRKTEEDAPVERCKIATTASSPSDKVFVTFPDEPGPNLRQEVQWEVGVTVSGGTLQPKYPVRGKDGIVIRDNRGELWLISFQ